MSWHYSQALEEACLPDGSKDGISSVQSRLKPTVEKPSSDGRMRDTSIPSQSGMISEHSTGDPFVDVWILLQQAHHASHTPNLDTIPMVKIHAISGLTPYASLGRFNPESSSWKMSLNYLLQDTFHRWPKTWPRAGIVLDGVCYPLPKWMPRIKEIELGLLPTPAASDWKREVGKSQYSRRSPGLSAQLGGVPHPEYLEWMMGWPIGWTASKLLEMDRFQEWLDLHGAS